MSIWNDAGDFVESGKWTHWPNPFGRIKNITVHMCNDGIWLAEIEFYAAIAASFFFTNLVPSPVEIFRKTFTGGYRCGFYLKVLKWSPGDIIWGAGTTRIIAQMIGPFFAAVYYWWLASTVIEALDTWTSVIYAEEMCGLKVTDCLAADGAGSLIVIGDGSSTGFEVFYDPSNLFNGIGSFIQPGVEGYYAFASFTVTNQALITLNYRVYLSNCNGDNASSGTESLAPGESKDFFINGKVDPGLHTIQARVELFTDPGPGRRIHWVCQRFGATLTAPH